MTKTERRGAVGAALPAGDFRLQQRSEIAPKSPNNQDIAAVWLARRYALSATIAAVICAEIGLGRVGVA